MCLGWASRANCKVSDPIAIPGTAMAPTAESMAAGNAGDGSASCNPTWFYLALAGILGYGLVKKG